jgi:peroxiredoxin
MHKATHFLLVMGLLTFCLGRGYIPDAGAKEIRLIKAGDQFAELPMPVPTDPQEQAYLGLQNADTFTLSQIRAELVLVEILSVYCYSCTRQAPAYNELYKLIEEDPKTRGRIKIIGIAAGNGKFEVDDFREKLKVAFPVIPDRNFAVHRAIGGSRTPFSIYVRQNPAGQAGVVAGTHLGQNLNYHKVFADLSVLMTMDLASIKAQGEKKSAITMVVEPILSDRELRKKVRELFATFNGKIKVFQKVDLKDSSRDVYTCIIEDKGKSKRLFAEVTSRPPPCVDCHDIHFVYAFDGSGEIVGFWPLQLTKYENEPWDDGDVDEMRSRVMGKSFVEKLHGRTIADPFIFDPQVDAVSSATITSGVIFNTLSQGEMLLKELKAKGLI